MKIIKKMKPYRICIILLLVSIFAYFFEVHALTREWKFIDNCDWGISILKDHYNSIDPSKFPADAGNSLSRRWQNLTVEYKIILQKDMDFKNYCANLKSKADPTVANLEKFKSMCRGGNTNSSCDSWQIEIYAEMDKRESELVAFHKQFDPFLERANRLLQNLIEFTESLDQARCDAVKKEFSLYKRSFEHWENMKKPLQDKINNLRKKIAETLEYPSNIYTAQDLVECETLAYSMIGKGGGVHCRYWDEGDWYEKNPTLGHYKVEKYYLEVDLFRLDKEAKRVIAGWQGKYIYYRFQERIQCPDLEKLEKLY